MAKLSTVPGLSKPTMDTRFYIDYEWWEESGKTIDLHIREFCNEYGSVDLDEVQSDEIVDWIDLQTGIVARVNRAKYTFLTTCCTHPEFITERTTLIEALFRTFLSVDNRPMTAGELAARTGRPAQTILKTLSGRTVYKGLRPYPGHAD